MPIFQANQLRKLGQGVFEALGAPEDEAAIVSEHLVTANLMGVDTHGVIRIPEYFRLVKEGHIKPAGAIKIEKETETTAIVDCGWNFGQVGAFRAIEIAITKARRSHTATVVTRNCSHAGRLGAYTQLAAENGLLAFAGCNSPMHPPIGRCVVPWGGREARLGTNPISFAVPTDLGYPILSDFSTAAVPEGKVRLLFNQGKQLPPGSIIDAEGKASVAPADFYGPPMGAILPFGGHQGYRGFALALLADILGFVLTGQDITVLTWGNGLGFILVDVSAFIPLPEFHKVVRKYIGYLKSAKPAEGFAEILLPGEPEFRCRDRRLREGIPIDEETWQQICKTSRALGVEFQPS